MTNRDEEHRELTKQIATKLALSRYLQFCPDPEQEYDYDPLDSKNQASPRSIGQRCTNLAAGIAAGILDELQD